MSTKQQAIADPKVGAGKSGGDPKLEFIQPAAFCYETDDVKTVLRRMEELKLDVIPVVDEKRRLVGLFERPV